LRNLIDELCKGLGGGQRDSEVYLRELAVTTQKRGEKGRKGPKRPDEIPKYSPLLNTFRHRPGKRRGKKK